MRAVAAIVGLLLAACTDDAESVDTATTAGGGEPTPGAVLACPPGELAREDNSCDPPGVPADGCGVGFASDDSGGCVATVPRCMPGELALAGERVCRPVATCRGGPWGAAPIAPDTQFVDASFTGGSDGSATKPWKTVQQGIDAAAADAVVAIAPGIYDEDVVVSAPVKLWGRCPGEVQIGGAGADPAISVEAPAELRALAVTGEGVGVLVAASDVVLEQVWVHDTSLTGVRVDGADAVLRGALIENAIGVGALLVGATLTIETSSIRDSQPLEDGRFGRGISVEPLEALPSQLSLQQSLLERNHQAAILSIGSELVVEDSWIRDTRASADGGIFGSGIESFYDEAGGHAPAVSVTASVFEQGYSCGICAFDGELTVERTSVRDVQSEPSTGWYGYGIQLYAERGRPVARVRASLVERVSGFGVSFAGADGEIETTLVRDVVPETDGLVYGRGITVDLSEDTLEGANVTVRGARVERAHEAGFSVLSSEAVLDSVHAVDIEPRGSDGTFGVGIAVVPIINTFGSGRATITRAVVERAHVGGLLVAAADVVASDVVVRDTRQQPEGAVFGDGVMVSSYLVIIPDLFPTSLEATRLTVANHPRAGVAAFAASVRLADSLFDCNSIDLNGESVNDVTFEVVDDGGNTCGCADARQTCKVLTSNLEPPSLF